MDFKSGFWQVRMAPESQQYTARSQLATLVSINLSGCPLDCVMHACDVPAFDAEYTGRAQSDLLCIIYLG